MARLQDEVQMGAASVHASAHQNGLVFRNMPFQELVSLTS
jgi:hypothetical protein